MLPQLTPILVCQVWQQECKHLFLVEWMKAKHTYGPCSIFVTQYCVLCAQFWFPALSPGECHKTILQKHLTRGVTIFWQNMYSWWCIILCLKISHKQSCMWSIKAFVLTVCMAVCTGALSSWLCSTRCKGSWPQSSTWGWTICKHRLSEAICGGLCSVQYTVENNWND